MMMIKYLTQGTAKGNFNQRPFTAERLAWLSDQYLLMGKSWEEKQFSFAYRKEVALRNYQKLQPIFKEDLTLNKVVGIITQPF